jgi:hypothetical protein
MCGTESKRSDVLEWIYSNPTVITNEQVHARYCDSTCLWFLDTYAYKNWVDKNRRFLLCNGAREFRLRAGNNAMQLTGLCAAGVGKSTLT